MINAVLAQDIPVVGCCQQERYRLEKKIELLSINLRIPYGGGNFCSLDGLCFVAAVKGVLELSAVAVPSADVFPVSGLRFAPIAAAAAFCLCLRMKKNARAIIKTPATQPITIPAMAPPDSEEPVASAAVDVEDEVDEVEDVEDGVSVEGGCASRGHSFLPLPPHGSIAQHPLKSLHE